MWKYIRGSLVSLPGRPGWAAVTIVVYVDCGYIIAALDMRSSPFEEWSAAGVGSAWRQTLFAPLRPLSPRAKA